MLDESSSCFNVKQTSGQGSELQQTHVQQSGDVHSTRNSSKTFTFVLLRLSELQSADTFAIVSPSIIQQDDHTHVPQYKTELSELQDAIQGVVDVS